MGARGAHEQRHNTVQIGGNKNTIFDVSSNAIDYRAVAKQWALKPAHLGSVLQYWDSSGSHRLGSTGHLAGRIWDLAHGSAAS
jgi:hypothetical protein